MKTRGVTNGSYQWIGSEKNDDSSPTPVYRTFKNACEIEVKEKRDAETVDLLGFFLQTECKDEEFILLRLTDSEFLLV